MTNKKTKAKKGFTIIEVVLVLAIAGLIFLMVFVALPTLQRNQRDTARKNDLDRFQSSLISYISSNNKIPGALSGDAAFDSDDGLYTRQCDGSGTDTDICYDYNGKIDADKNNTWAKFVRNYLLAEGDNFEDQSGNPYILNVTSFADASIADDATYGATAALFPSGEGFTEYTGTIAIAINASCNDDDDLPFVKRASDGRRSFAVALKLETGAVYCLDN